ncbi:MAG: glycosyltransferase family 2 protein [Planctomycetes bacterium]|nr:glycosyltransferase family 2 protein [Planctomycetota bacterium]
MSSGRPLWVVIPAFEEEHLIVAVLRGMPECVERIVVVDDASTDGTVAAVRGSVSVRLELLQHSRNRGVGAAITTGYRHFVEQCKDPRALCVVMAGDNQMDPADLPQLLAAIDNGADYAKGNRFAQSAARRSMPFARWFGNIVLTLLTRVATGMWHVTDSQCGYTVVTRSTLAGMELARLYPRYGFPNDMLLHLAACGARVVDVPVRAVYAGERSKIRLLRVAPRIAWLLLRGWWQRTHHCGAHGWLLCGLWGIALLAAFAAIGGFMSLNAAALTAGACILSALLLDSLRSLRLQCACLP